MDTATLCYAVAFALGIASFWVSKLTGLAIAAIALAALLGR